MFSRSTHSKYKRAWFSYYPINYCLCDIQRSPVHLPMLRQQLVPLFLYFTFVLQTVGSSGIRKMCEERLMKVFISLLIKEHDH